jgi:amino acid adenylation domain-containing protein
LRSLSEPVAVREGAPALDLPTDFPRRPGKAFHAARRAAGLTAELSADLRAFCRREGVTLPALLLAGFDVLLARYSGQQEIRIAVPDEDEGVRELRADLEAALSFREVLFQAGSEDATAFFTADLSLFADDRGDSLRLEVEYDADLFRASTAHRLLGHLGRLLEAAVADPDRRWRDLPLLTAEEEQVLADFNDTGSTSGPDVCLHQLFETTAARIPDQVAVIAPEARLTYRELNERADRLAHRLRALGLGPEKFAGVLMDRTADLIVALLAIQKAGGAYAPLDPSYPKQRVRLMLETARATLLITRRHLAEDLPEGLRTVFLDPGWEDEPAEAELPEILPENLAYVIFTSGSTGIPKGVAIQHRSAVSMVRWCLRMYSPEEYAGILVSTSICFDMSVFEIFATLAAGGRLILAENALALPKLAAKDEVVLVDTVPSAIAELLRGGGLPSTIRTVNLGGEPLKASLVREIYEKLPSVERVVNLYGPSEDTTFTSYAVVPRDTDHPLIGRALTGEQAHVLDREMRPVPVGVPGALYMGGEGVTRGYLHRPDLTAERYVPNPYGLPGSRLYTVGDLVRYLPTGELDYLGRLDHQVKVRGFRVELGEIEATLTRHPEVREAAVLAAADLLGGTRLIAWVETERDLPAADLRAHLKQNLPDYMVPSLFLQLRELPLTPNGKIDRRALATLPLPEDAREERRAPSGYVEEVLAEIWSEVFGRPVGVEDDFLDLGGHSLLAARVLSQVRAVLGVELPLRDLFAAPTVAGLALAVEARRSAEDTAPAARIEPLADRSALPLSFAQQRLWFLDRLDPDSAVYNLPIAFRLTGALDPGLLERALDEVFRRHEALRTTFAEAPDGEARQVVAPFRPAGLPQADLTGLPPVAARAEAARQAALEARRPFDLVHGPVVRPLLLRLGAEEHHLLFFCHHIAFDGWSVGVLRRELGALYDAFRNGRPSPLPEPAFQYGDFAVWQRGWLAGEALEARLVYWRDRLAGAPAVLDLPADRPRPPVQSFRGATLAIPFPAELAEGVHALSRSQGSTLFMTALAAFSALLRRFTGQEDLVMGSPVANRAGAGTDDLIGFFVNTLALRADVSGDPPFHVLAGRARESALADFARQDLPFERLVEELLLERDLSRGPLFQVLFALAPMRDGEIAPGLGCELMGVDTRTSKFDLSVFLQEEEDGGLSMELEYASDLFDPATVTRLGRSWLRLLAGLVEEGTDRRVSELPLLGEEERWQLLGEWWEPGPEIPEETCLNDLVAAQAERTPEAVALVHGRERITYRELGRRVRKLARRLAALGVGPEVRVGVCLSRTPALVTALLGILEAGGAYVPLDPNYPRERLGFMLEDCLPRVLITETALLPRLPETSAHLLVMDGEIGEEEAEPLRAFPSNLSYLIYTSGSTGRPKAVAIAHRSAVAMVRWAQRTFGPEELEAVLFATSVSFDVSVAELFVTLASGGRLILADNILHLPDLPAVGEVTLISAVPSAIAVMTELLRAFPPRVLAVNLGGEPVKSSLSQALYAGGVKRVRNLYGPSEDTTYSTCELIERDGRREPTIGRPITGTWVRMLDRDLRPVPVGVPGELYLGGAGLSRGYYGRPEMTAARYVPDPLESAPGARLYRTGDLARFLPDGRIEYLGRLDHQVKVRGIRIELGEIEAAVMAHPRVREAVVVALPQPGGDHSLAAYFVADFVADAAPAPTAGELRDYLRGRLIEAMVPSSFTRLAQMPLNPNGKVERKALPAPDLGDGVAGGPAARVEADPLVELLAGIWAEVLGLEALPGPEESFFELGGHSLLATRVVARIRTALGVELPLRALFSAPTLSALAAAVAARRGSSEGVAEPIEPIEHLARLSDLPLSFAQQRLWLLDQFEPGSRAYNLPVHRRILGPLDPAALERALGEVVRRHEVLRTTFRTAPESGEPRLAVAPPGAFSLPRVDLSGLPVREREAEAARLVVQESWRPFDLAAGPIFRAALLAAGPADHRLLMTMHHIAGDGWSNNVLLGELSALYRAFAAGLPSPLPELPVQYSDFAAWQRRWLQGPVLEAQLAYWRKQLAGIPEALDLPADRPRPPVASTRGAWLFTPLPAELASAVRAFSRHHGATLFMTLLAGFAALLQRLTGEEDLAIGSPVAGRGRADVEGLVGFFVNTLVLRAGLGGEPGFGDLVARVRETALAAYAHQDLPFERLVEELQPERSLARTPLFQVGFALGVEESVHELAPGLPLSHLDLEIPISKFDLTLSVEVQGEALVCGFEYRTSLYDRATVARWAGHFTHLLAAAMAAPDMPLPRLGMLSAAERHQVSAEWNDTVTGDSSTPFVHRLFAEHARRAPEALAVAGGGTRWSYGELDGRANRLARTLRALGCGPEVRVGLCLERSPDLVLAALAILKTGGAFVALDPSHPLDRLLYQLEDSGAPVLLARRGPLADQAAERGIHCLFPDEERDGGDATAVDSPALDPSNLAYVIYTSGSTGLPKAVEVPHAGLANLVRWHQGFYEVTPEDRACLVASPAFDASVWEVWPYLAAGASVHVPGEEARLSPSRLLQWWAEEGITLSFLMTPLTDEILEEAIPSGLRLRALITGGDRLHGHPTADAPYRLMNHYGPTEASVVTTVATVPSHLPGRADDSLPTLGRPLDNARVHLLDRWGAPVPVGVAGELHIAGRGLARGYHGRPDLTAELFVPDPFASEPGGRLYRTGDLARQRPDGEIEFLGRIDHQVKLRGYRIELGEIEAALGAHPAVDRAVVATHAWRPGDLRLAAWVVPAEGEPEIEPGALLAWLGERLPDYMVPSAVVVLEALPVTPNGKVDRRALPLPAAPEGTAAAEPPRSPLEALVAGLWAESLGRGKVGLHDDFFDLGGHSLLAVRLLVSLRAATGIDLPPRAIFTHRTVASLVAEVERSLRDPGAAQLPPVEPAQAGDEAPASSAQERLWFFHQLDPTGSTLNVPHPLRLRGPLRPEALASALAGLAGRHGALRTTFAYGDGGLRQRIAPPAPLALPRVDLGALPPSRREGEARRLTAEEAREPFDLAAGPLWRVRLLRLEDREHVLLLSFHHAIVDGWSVGILERDLAALLAGDEPVGPALQYADFALWQRRWQNDEALASQLAYWRRQLAGMPPSLDLPSDRPRPARPSFRGGLRSLTLSPGLSAGVKELARQEGSTLFMAAFAAFAALLGRYTGRTDVVLGSPAANRHQPGTEGIVGFFVANMVLRLDLGGDPAFRELLHRAREAALGAYAHPDVPFERLVEELDVARDKSRSPLFQVMLSVQEAAGEPLRFGDLSAEPVEVHSATSQFDLTLFLDDQPGGLLLLAEYSTDLFEAETVERLLAHLSSLLGAVVADPGLRLSGLPAGIAPRPAAAPALPETSPEPVADDRTRRQAQLAESRSRMAAAERELLEQRLRRLKK